MLRVIFLSHSKKA